MTELKILISLLKKKRLTVAAAESVSGGWLSYLLTKIPGSSKIFKGGIVAYSLWAKHRFFKIPTPLLKKSQGVSREVALLLAKRVRKLFCADIGVSLVGFAGPEAQKGIRVGTVFMGIAYKKAVTVKKAVIKGARDKVRKKSSRALIGLLYERLTQ
jgi:PncC family amidohydrolase